MTHAIHPTYFVTPVLERYLVYAPLQQFSVLLDENGLQQLGIACAGGREGLDPLISEIAQRLDGPLTAPRSARGNIKAPLFLGLITTRGCNMDCRYCDFSALRHSPAVMDLDLARSSVDAYLELLKENGITDGEIQFFGGEPFFQNTVIEFVLAYARNRALKAGITIRFNVTTNGLMSEKRARWAADHFDAVVLSLDGAAFQDRQRPLTNGNGSYALVHRTAKILSEGKTELILRACVTHDSVRQLPALARDWADTYIPSAMCFEPLTESRLSRENGLFAPEPLQFARQFCLSEDILTPYGIDTICSGTDIDSLQASFCPVGKDALLISPAGNISACYLMQTDWARAGLDLTFGTISADSPRFLLDLDKLETIRDLTRQPAPLCESCLCRYHCAGGCYVNHHSIRQATQYDAVCVRTRLITVGKLLRRMGALELYQRWLDKLAACSGMPGGPIDGSSYER